MGSTERRSACNLSSSPIDLDKVLQSFYAEVRKTNGDEYGPNSLARMQTGIDRHLKENNYHVLIIRDRVFSTSRAVPEGKCKNLEHGKGKRPNESNSLSESAANILWECGQLGTQSPMSLINKIWWLFTLHFGLRGRQEHHSRPFSDFPFKKDDFGNELVTFAEGITKTRRQSGLHETHRLIQPKIFATYTSRCPVNIFQFFLSKRPSQVRLSGSLCLSIIHKPVSNSLWYKNVPMGQHTLHYEKNDRKFSRSNSLKEKV